MRKIWLAISAIVFLFSAGKAQKKIVILGSSTAQGYTSSVYDSAWAGRLQLEFRKNTQAGNPDTVVNNMAWSGYTTYQVMPTGYVPPPGRPTPTAYNITNALLQAPDVIIINLPTNDIGSGFAKEEYMNNLRLFFQMANNQGVRCYIATPQPRNFEPEKRQALRELVDSVNNNFGVFAINFWDDLISNDGLYFINAVVNVDGTHVNDIGHRYLFQRVKAKNIFALGAPLPLSLRKFSAQIQNASALVSWSTVSEDANTHFTIQRSADGISFSDLGVRNAKGTGEPADYTWLDQNPLEGRNFYRLKISETAKTSFSAIASVSFKTKKAYVRKINWKGSSLTLGINSAVDQPAVLNIVSTGGAVVHRQNIRLLRSGLSISLPLSSLASGQYIIQLTSTEGVLATEKFTVLK